MKLYSCFLILAFFLSVTALAQPQEKKKDSVITQLGKLKLENYFEKATDSLLSKLPSKFIFHVLKSDRPLFKHMALLNFKERPYLIVKLYYRDFQLLNPQAVSKERQLADLKQELLYGAEVINGSVCINGCER